jgi:hypothetical protein
MKEHTYTKGSWQAVTDEIKKSLGINCLTQSQASTIMSMYLKGTDVQKMIEILKGEKK